MTLLYHYPPSPSVCTKKIRTSMPCNILPMWSAWGRELLSTPFVSVYTCGSTSLPALYCQQQGYLNVQHHDKKWGLAPPSFNLQRPLAIYSCFKRFGSLCEQQDRVALVTTIIQCGRHITSSWYLILTCRMQSFCGFSC